MAYSLALDDESRDLLNKAKGIILYKGGKHVSNNEALKIVLRTYIQTHDIRTAR